jgi:Fe-Mn family superoxide dismutase
MYEHAYHLDHGAAAGAYVDSFMANIAWGQVYERYQQAVHAASEGLAAEAGAVEADGVLLLDVRRDAIFAQAPTMLPGARWCDPAKVQDWAADLPRDRQVLVYCIYGHEVGRSTAMKLQALGVQARFLTGGIDAWTQAGRPLQAKETSA